MRFMRKRVDGAAKGFSMPKGRSKGWKRKLHSGSGRLSRSGGGA